MLWTIGNDACFPKYMVFGTILFYVALQKYIFCLMYSSCEAFCFVYCANFCMLAMLYKNSAHNLVCLRLI